MSAKRTIFTISYGGKSREEFLEPLKRHGVEVVADVPMFPGRASMGMYGKAKSSGKGIEKTLGEAGMGYEWVEELGNPDLKDPEMKGLRDLLAREAAEHTRRLTELASRKTVCLLCSEKAHEDCHRSLIGDYLAEPGLGGRAALKEFVPWPWWSSSR
jgi:uncharacterized protein (DUF488 family)